MSRDSMLFYNLVMVFIILMVYFMIYFSGKKKSKPIWLDLSGWTGIAAVGLVVLNYVIPEKWSYDKFGNAYAYDIQDSINEEMTEIALNDGPIFQDSEGNKYYICESKLLNVDDQEEVYKVQDCYLNHKGILVLDKEEKYMPTSDRNIVIAEDGKRVYTLWSCWWTWWGEFESPEPKGIYWGNYYIRPMNTLNPDYLENISVILLCLLTIGIPIIYIFLAVIHMYRRERIPSKIYDKIIVYLFGGLLESVYFLNSDSIVSFLISVPFCMVLSYVMIPFLVGGMELENNEQMDNKKGTLADYYFLEIVRYANTDYVNLLRKRSLFVCIRYFVYWGGITIINCVL